MADSGWNEIAALIEAVATDPAVLAQAVDDARAASRAIAALEPTDVARRTRDLLSAATRAIAARRGASDAELDFVADLAVTRAQQGIPIGEVLAAIHVSSRRIWSAARDLAAARGIDAGMLLHARELYDDWAQAVQQRLLAAHRSAEIRASRAHATSSNLIRRLLQGGSAATLAASEAGLDPSSVMVGISRDPGAVEPLAAWLRGAGVVGRDDRAVVLVTSRLSARPRGATSLSAPRSAGQEVRGGWDGAASGASSLVGLAGPGDVREAAHLRRLADSAVTAAAALGRTGVVHITDVAAVAALLDRADLAASLTARHADDLATLGTVREPTLRTTRRWLELGRNAAAVAAEQYVHPNTVRNRVAAVTSATGLDPADVFDAAALWLLCRENAISE